MTDIRKLIKAVEADKAINDDFNDAFGLSPTGNNGIAAYHGSLDAAKALHEALLPGWDCLLNSRANYAQVWEMKGVGDANANAMSVHGGLSRAWLLAILKAYEATQ